MKAAGGEFSPSVAPRATITLDHGVGGISRIDERARIDAIDVIDEFDEMTIHDLIDSSAPDGPAAQRIGDPDGARRERRARMSTAPTASPATLPEQHEIYDWVRGLLTGVTDAVLDEQPELGGFVDRRPQRDRSSGETWRGTGTLCHVSALLASSGAPDLSGDSARDLLAAADRAALARGLRRRSESESQGISGATWRTGRGDLLEVIVGVQVAVRVISAPFLAAAASPVVVSTSPTTRPSRSVG
ncbi:hypothetical protein ACTXL6_07535 [Brachybacterium tyrofermentans]|uniref:hypothetical protein n=1 Tax=Brachybacterium tyrofermentans TaxID=47848 RepID=UPI003FD1B420